MTGLLLFFFPILWVKMDFLFGRGGGGCRNPVMLICLSCRLVLLVCRLCVYIYLHPATKGDFWVTFLEASMTSLNEVIFITIHCTISHWQHIALFGLRSRFSLGIFLTRTFSLHHITLFGCELISNVFQRELSLIYILFRTYKRLRAAL